MEAVERRARTRVRNGLLAALGILLPLAGLAAWLQADAALFALLLAIIAAPPVAQAAYQWGWRRRKLQELAGPASSK